MLAAKFKCSVDQAKRSIYHAANSIFIRVRRVGRLATEEVMVQLLKYSDPTYALEICSIDKLKGYSSRLTLR